MGITSILWYIKYTHINHSQEFLWVTPNALWIINKHMHHKAELFKLAPSKSIFRCLSWCQQFVAVAYQFFWPLCIKFFNVGDHFIQLTIFIFDAVYKDKNELFVIITDIYLYLNLQNFPLAILIFHVHGQYSVIYYSDIPGFT